MRFGIQVGTYFPGDWTATQTLDHVELLAAARDHHIDGLFAGHRYLAGRQTALLHPFVLLGHLSGMCPGMYVGTAIYLLPLHNAVESAEQAAALDLLSRGRFLFGIGLGYNHAEFRSFQVDKRDRRARAQESVDLMRRLWTEDEVTHQGRFFQVGRSGSNPRPWRRGGPPILVGADTLAAVQRAPELGDHWLPSRRHSKTFLRQALPLYQAALDARGRPFRGLPMYRTSVLRRPAPRRNAGRGRPTRPCTRLSATAATLASSTTSVSTN